mmetsp:Transcript_33359/g.54112  ORF Transcript_33359/g.54112 Transcript_33359/m.54112 type:complete len:244 (-) Transcript_33359:2122-2853(-)
MPLTSVDFRRALLAPGRGIFDVMVPRGVMTGTASLRERGVVQGLVPALGTRPVGMVSFSVPIPCDVIGSSLRAGTSFVARGDKERRGILVLLVPLTGLSRVAVELTLPAMFASGRASDKGCCCCCCEGLFSISAIPVFDASFLSDEDFFKESSALVFAPPCVLAASLLNALISLGLLGILTAGLFSVPATNDLVIALAAAGLLIEGLMGMTGARVSTEEEGMTIKALLVSAVSMDLLILSSAT